MDLNGKKVVITCGGGLGDMLTFTPALRRLKEKWPGCRVVFLTKYGTHEVMSKLPYVDELVCIRRGSFLGRYRVLPDIWGADAIVFTDWQPQLLAAAKFFGIPVRAGGGKSGHKFYGYLTCHIKHDVMKETDYAALTHARIIGEGLGVELDGDMSRLEISLPDEREASVAEELLREAGVDPNTPYVVLSPFTSYYKRDWPLAEAVELVKTIERRLGMPTVVIGNAAKAEEQSFTHSLIGKTGIMELVEIIKRAACLVTPDSGPMHVGAALGTPTVALFSKDLPSRWAPRHCCKVIYLGVDCSPCSDEAMHACQEPVCINKIRAEDVFKGMQELMELARDRRDNCGKC